MDNEEEEESLSIDFNFGSSTVLTASDEEKVKKIVSEEASPTKESVDITSIKVDVKCQPKTDHKHKDSQSDLSSALSAASSNSSSLEDLGSGLSSIPSTSYSSSDDLDISKASSSPKINQYDNPYCRPSMFGPSPKTGPTFVSEISSSILSTSSSVSSKASSQVSQPSSTNKPPDFTKLFSDKKASSNQSVVQGAKSSDDGKSQTKSNEDENPDGN